MLRRFINIVMTTLVYLACCFSISLTAFADEGSFQSIPSNIAPCIGDCQKEIYPYAILSKDAYEKTNHDRDLPENWTFVGTDGFGSGFSGSLYLNSVEKKIVYAFRGTELDDAFDIATDLIAFIGYVPICYVQAVVTLFNYIDILKTKSDTFKDWDLILTGHSLGGGLAQFVAKVYGLKAYTFNTAPIHSSVGNVATVVSFLAPLLIDYQNIVGIGSTDILNIVSYNTSGFYFDVVSWSPGNLYGTTKSFEIDDANGPVSTHAIGTIVSQLEQNLFTLPDEDIKLDKYDVTVKTGDTETISISGGTGYYTVNSSDTQVATATLNASIVEITGLSAGSVVITVEDTGGVTISISVTVSSSTSPSGTCGAYVAPGVWKEFDCYNLAAIGKTTGDDPFTPSWRLNGGYWQWGRKGPDPGQWYNTNTEHFAHGPTGPGSGDANKEAISEWDQISASDGAWSDSFKTANDPCPDGFRVPTQSQWVGVRNNNTQSMVGSWNEDDTNYSAARFFGSALMLQNAGYRNYLLRGAFGHRVNGRYWSTSEEGSSRAWYLYFSSWGTNTSTTYRMNGLSIRCISE